MDAASAIDADDSYISKLRKGWRPKQLQPKTRARIIAFLREYEMRPDPPRPLVVRESPARCRYSPALDDDTRIWVQEFLLELTRAGCTEEEVDEARLLLTKSDLVAYASAGRSALEPVTDAERLQLVKAIAAAAIIPTLRKLGRHVDASLAR